ncbi:hypothetical protein EYZ11_010207 [Aspergillus tanneri]|uniref:Uncharacterized protein n=1 Tax=Aspergillus tanneri TaxID=1220188 RepID=A0A4S3J816_9EURO|nr:hypothetical protein EYZ11_010207 [Aspergillus tanneri]
MDNFLLWPRQAGAQTTAPSPTLSTPTPANQAGAFSTPDRASPSTWSSATSPNSSFSSSSSTVSTSTTSAASTSETLSTASTASSSTSDSTQTSDRSRGVSNGTLAGAIIGSIAGTAIVALLVAILYIRFRRNKEARTTQGASSTTRDTPKPLGEIQTQSRLPPVGTQEKEPSGTSSAPWSLLLNLSSYVPDPADDHAVCTRIQTLFDQAGLHVDNYYTPASPMVRPTQDAVARVNHYGSPFLPSSVATMLSKPRAQRPVLTHVLVRTLLNAIQPGMGTESLLPQPYASSPPHQGNAVFGSGKAPHSILNGH